MFADVQSAQRQAPVRGTNDDASCVVRASAAERVRAPHASRLASALAVAAAMLLPAFVAPANVARAAERDLRSPLIGRTVPDFAMRAIGGGNLRLSEHRGDVVLVGFWTSWCGTCREYLERLGRLHATYGTAGLVVVGVSLDDDARRATSLVQAVGAKFPNVFDGRKELGEPWRVGDVPMTVLVDRAGVVRHVYGELQRRDDADLVAEIRKLLDE